MRLAIIESGLPPERIGGAELQAWGLAKRLSVRHDVTCFTREVPGCPKAEERDGVRVIRIPLASVPFRFISHVHRFSRAITGVAGKMDAVIAFRVIPNGLAAARAHRHGGPPFVASVRGGDWYFRKQGLFNRLWLRSVWRGASRVVTQSPRIASDVTSEFPRVHPEIIPNGIDRDSRTASGYRVVFLGNLSARKGVDVLIEAMRGVDAGLTVIGDGPERARLEKMAEGMDVQFAGCVEPCRARDLLVESGRIFVLPAVRGEGFPNALMEAMSVGLPVVASDVAGVADLLENGRNGCLVPPGDPVKLRKAISDLLKDDSRRSSFAQRGRDSIEKYTWEKVAEAWEKLCVKIVS